MTLLRGNALQPVTWLSTVGVTVPVISIMNIFDFVQVFKFFEDFDCGVQIL